jgi:hypothetical protein
MPNRVLDALCSNWRPSIAGGRIRRICISRHAIGAGQQPCGIPESCPQQFPLLYIALSYCCFNLPKRRTGTVWGPIPFEETRLRRPTSARAPAGWYTGRQGYYIRRLWQTGVREREPMDGNQQHTQQAKCRPGRVFTFGCAGPPGNSFSRTLCLRHLENWSRRRSGEPGRSTLRGNRG